MQERILSKGAVLLRRIAIVHQPCPILPARFWNNAVVLNMGSPRLRKSVSIGAKGKPVGVGSEVYHIMDKAGASMAIQGREPDPVARASGKLYHIANDFFVDAGTTIKAPLRGVVILNRQYDDEDGRSNLVILRHAVEIDGKPVVFDTLYDHLSDDSQRHLRMGQLIKKGAVFARVGTCAENGGVLPQVHFQIHLFPEDHKYSEACNEKGSLTKDEFFAGKENFHDIFPDPVLLFHLIAPWYERVVRRNKWPQPSSS